MAKTTPLTLVRLLLLLPLRPAPALAQAEPAPSHDAAQPVAAQPAPGAHGEVVEEHNLLKPDPGSAVWSVVLFVLILIVLRIAAWGPILKGLQGREEKLRNDLTGAEQSALKAAATLEDYRKQLATAGIEARKIVEQSRADAQKLAADLHAQAQADIEAARQRAQAEIAAARQQALADIYTHTATLATDVAGKILKREIRPDDQRQLIDESLAEFKRANTNN